MNLREHRIKPLIIRCSIKLTRINHGQGVLFTASTFGTLRCLPVFVPGAASLTDSQVLRQRVLSDLGRLFEALLYHLFCPFGLLHVLVALLSLGRRHLLGEFSRQFRLESEPLRADLLLPQ